MNVIELFAGSCSFSTVAKELGYKTFTSDIEQFGNIDYVINILNFDIRKVPFIPTIIWASPPCTTYSIAAISHHRKGVVPISDLAKISDSLLNKTVELIDYYLSINHDLKFFIENPVGMMRKMPIIKQFDRATITYCSYGDIRMKPTDIWTNDLATLYNPHGWRPLTKCFNNNINCHHESAPRGSKTGTQGLDNDFERSKIPFLLCIEILNRYKK